MNKRIEDFLDYLMNEWFPLFFVLGILVAVVGAASALFVIVLTVTYPFFMLPFLFTIFLCYMAVAIRQYNKKV